MASLEESQKQLKLECEQLWEELKSLQKEVNEKRNVETTQKDTALSQIYKQKKHLLEAQLHVMKETSPYGPSSDKTTQITMIKDNSENEVTEIEETLLHISEQRRQAEDEVKMLTVQVAQHKQVLTVLEEKIQQFTDSSVDSNASRVIENLKADKSKVESYRKSVMKQLASFVNKHFPHPSGQRPLLEIIEGLMNKCIESPNAPYVHIKDTWQPYVELLLRTGIAVSHNENDKLLRLTPFHL